MIQFNLLPDVKLEYIKAQRTRHMVTGVSIIVSLVAAGLLLALLGANLLQKKHLNDLSRDIASQTTKLQNEPQIDKILTVQNQLQSLTALHTGKPAASHLFDYLNQLTPNAVAISNLTIDMTQQTATITGTADALSSVNQYVDTLKFTTYTTGSGGSSSSNTKAFSNVVLSSFGRSSDNTNGKPASYSITLNYDKTIFDNTQEVKLVVPRLTTTRSELERPSDLFQPGPAAPSSAASGSVMNQGAR